MIAHGRTEKPDETNEAGALGFCEAVLRLYRENRVRLKETGVGVEDLLAKLDRLIAPAVTARRAAERASARRRAHRRLVRRRCWESRARAGAPSPIFGGEAGISSIVSAPLAALLTVHSERGDYTAKEVIRRWP